MHTAFTYRAVVIGLLRVVGLLNAAVWLGAGLFLYSGILPAMGSDTMLKLIGASNFPYFSGAIFGLLEERYLYLQLVCSIVALVHLGAEWIYLGKYPRRALAFLLALFCFALVQAVWLGPRLQAMHLATHAVNLHPEQRAIAARAHTWWKNISRALGAVVLFGVGVHLWRVSIPSTHARFVTTTKLHS